MKDAESGMTHLHSKNDEDWHSHQKLLSPSLREGIKPASPRTENVMVALGTPPALFFSTIYHPDYFYLPVPAQKVIIPTE